MRLASAALLLALVPSIAGAQSNIFVDGGAIVGVRFTPSAEGDPSLFSLSGGLSYEWNDLNGDRRWQPGEEGALLPSSQLTQTSSGRVVPGGQTAIGVFLSSSVSLRLEASFNGESETVFSSNTQSLASTLEGRVVSSANDFAIAGGWHQGQSRRASITYLGGVVFRRQRDDTTLTTEYLLRSFITPTGGSFTSTPFATTFDQQFTSISYTTGVLAGVDVAITLSKHLAVVPQLRLAAFDQEWNVRPAIAMRWRP